MKAKKILDEWDETQCALKAAEEVQDLAAAVGFDWNEVDPVLDKCEEEFRELREAMASEKSEAIFDELGDVFFAIVNLARKLEKPSEDALRASSRKFRRRFDRVEEKVRATNKGFEGHTLEELDRLWDEVKVEENAE